MRSGGRALAAAAAFALAVAACGGGKSSAHRGSSRSTKSTADHPTARRPQATTTAAPGATGSTGGSSQRGSGPTTTTVEPHTLLQALIADSRSADVKVIYDTPNGRVTLIRRNGDSVYADSAGVRFTLGNRNYDCIGSGDGETCTRVNGNATLSDVDAYTGLVSDALSAPSYTVGQTTSSVLGRTAECVSIVGRQTAHAGSSVQACLDDDTGMLLRFSTFGPPNPGTKLWAVAIGTPTDADFRLPVPPT